MSHNNSQFQIYAYYLLSIVILCVFTFRGEGTIIENGGATIVMYILLPFVFAAIIRSRVESFIILKQHPILRPKRQFIFDFSLFFFIAASLLAIEMLVHENEFAISIKTFVWTMILGYFASIDSSLHRVRQGFDRVDTHENLKQKTYPLAQRLSIFLSTTVLIAMIAMAMSGYSYLTITTDESKSHALIQQFIVDALFVLGIVISLTVRVIFSYSLNLQHLFKAQTDVLRKVRKGELTDYVPVLTQDEFGIIAQQTNRMIDELRQKEKIQKTLERIVSPNIMQKLINGDAAELKQGQEHDIAILFCDLRKFTSFAENTSPEEVIFFLNAYFTKIADVVAEHGGIVNKFMGDAILAVFGVDGHANYVEQAVETAWDILMHSESVKMRDGRTIDVGIGVHMGRAAAGTIGSADRFEYTFIGDAVNTASRLDGLTKRLEHKILISDVVYEELNRDIQSRFIDLGEQKIRGKTKPLHVYGAVPCKNNYPSRDNVVPLDSARTLVS